MAKPMGKRRRRTKQTYLESGAGSLRSGTGTTAKAKKPKKSLFGTPFFPTPTKPKKGRAFRIPKPIKRELRPITPQSPATGLGSVFEKQAKRQRRRTATTLRRRAKR